MRGQSKAPPARPTPPVPPRATPPEPATAPDIVVPPFGVSVRPAIAPRVIMSPSALMDIEMQADALAMQMQSQMQSGAWSESLRSSLESSVMASTRDALRSSAFAVDIAKQSAEAAMAGVASAVDGLAWDVIPRIAPSLSVSGFGGRSFRTEAPPAWQSSDPADSLYREARKALSSDAYRRAADLFKRIRDQYPKSTYTPDAPYWEAFALQRLGTQTDLNKALEALEMQQEKFPRAATRGDASALRTRIEGQLARNGDQTAVESLIRRTQNATSDGCPRAQDDERVDALNAVARIDAEKALPILKKVLARREPCTQQLRRTAVWLIASQKQPEAAGILLNVAKTDPDKDVREQAVFWMANVPTEEATTMLIDLAKKSDDLDMQKRALYALSRSKSPRAATTLREIALDANADVDLRGTAMSWYMNGPGRTADDPMNFLKEMYGKADSRELKTSVLESIGRRKTDDARAFLVEVAQNPKESMEVRRSAIWSLRSSGATSAQLAQIYDRGGDVEVRKQVIGVLGGLRDNAGVDKLLDIARNEKNVDLRKQALTYLSRSKDPRALQLFQEIIDR